MCLGLTRVLGWILLAPHCAFQFGILIHILRIKYTNMKRTQPDFPER